MNRCGVCGFEWSAAGQAHCKGSRSEDGCHQQFNSTAAFDRHRTGAPDWGCIPVERFGDPMVKRDGSLGLPRLVLAARKSGDVWATALRGDR